MFGLMKHRTVNSDQEQPYAYRQFYCGTCKTLGKNFGQASRMLLNHDAIFLGELLNDVSQSEQDIFSKSKAYESFNCFRLPKDTEIPRSLQYAAAANVLLGTLSAEDHITDGNRVQRIGWKTVRNALKPALKKAEPVLVNSNLPIHQIYQWIDEQELRESGDFVFENYQKAVAYFAEPTAQITGLVFQYGTSAIGEAKLGNSFFEFGYQFGQLIYLLDAFEDFQKDITTQSFNGFLKAFDTCDQKLNQIEETLPFLKKQLAQTYKLLESLPISTSLKSVTLQRLTINTHRILGIAKSCCIHEPIDCSSKMTFKEKWQAVNELSTRILAKGASIKASWLGQAHQKTTHYTLAVTMMMAPEKHIRQLSEQPEIAESYTSLAYLPLLGAAMIGVLTLLPFVSSAMPKNPKEAMRKPKDCWSDCFSDCCTSCCETCCQACCDAVCEETCGSAGPS